MHAKDIATYRELECTNNYVEFRLLKAMNVSGTDFTNNLTTEFFRGHYKLWSDINHTWFPKAATLSPYPPQYTPRSHSQQELSS